MTFNDLWYNTKWYWKIDNTLVWDLKQSIDIIVKAIPLIQLEARNLCIVHTGLIEPTQDRIKEYLVSQHEYDAVDISHIVAQIKMLINNQNINNKEV